MHTHKERNAEGRAAMRFPSGCPTKGPSAALPALARHQPCCARAPCIQPLGGSTRSPSIALTGPAARVNLRAIGIGLQALIRIQTTHTGIALYVQLFQQMPEVLEADRVTGEDCFIVRCAIAQPGDLERVVDALAAHGAVTTSLVLSSPVRKAVTVPL